MKVVLDKAFPLAASADSAWQLMQDIEAVAACMPGAKITERIDDTHYKGTITVRLGPATMSFKGDIEVLALDAAARSLHLLGKGTDASGGSAATMDLTAAVEPTHAACTLTGKSEVTMSGKAAAIGGRLMAPASEQLLKQFVANFAARLDAMQAAQPVSIDSPQSETAQTDKETIAPAARASTPPPTQAAELNGFAFVWAMIRDWLHGRFSHKAQGR
ncbi:SRPBCC family protein [Burkholderia sp. Ac-20365]|jgi:carbon monoxide dehydrogenase subunit G|uniref:SRPBCC family protein n=1 Tax=Burkholderia sp. Ac-20365 TaxID=2703897 RepID=UPI00197BAA68|nr:SRPBCC family protein [Burkholderia sp. Ac-20365]MBN3763587.1 SRPBCC family protein [Burkholderia sp. Ac-20365]